MGYHWAHAKGNDSWDSMCRAVALLPKGQLWRHAIAGDLPGRGENLALARFSRLVKAASHTAGFTFTHKQFRRREEMAAVRNANRRAAKARIGLVINLSANGPAHADELAARRLGPVATVLPFMKEPPALLKTPKGRTIVVCPAQRSDITCAECGLCAKAWRKSIVGFVAHGQGRKLVTSVAEGTAP